MVLGKWLHIRSKEADYGADLDDDDADDNEDDPESDSDNEGQPIKLCFYCNYKRYCATDVGSRGVKFS